jgi:hypothetical protein
METLRPLIVVMLLLMMVVAGASQTETVASEPQQTNLLTNPSFEDPYEGGSAAGWSRWHRDSQVKPESCSDAYAFTPQWSRETNGALVRDGFVSQHIGNQFDTWNAGVMQTVNVTPGTTYRFSFWAIGRASNEQFPVASDTVVNLGVRAAIDPNGSGLWTDADVVWGGAVSPHDSGDQANWQQAVVETTATGNQITVFVSANLMGANNCRAHLDVWFDGAQLIEVGPPPTETPPPQPTIAPQPTAAATLPPAATATTEAEVTPTNTPVPTETPTSTPEPPSTGLLCVNAFGDVNADGQKDANEGAMAGVTFTVAQSSQIVARGVSSGPEPVCFDLEPGDYQVVQEVPPTLEMTTGAVAAIALSEGQTVRVEFGSRVRQQSASTGTGDEEILATPPDPAAGSAGSEEETATTGSLLAYSGLAVLFLAIVLLGGLLYYLLRQRA